MRLSHHCASCGCDLTDSGREWFDAIKAFVVRCPRCPASAVLRSDRRHQWWRQVRRLLPALPVLVVSTIVIGAGTMTLMSTSLLMVVTHEIQSMRWPLRIGPHTLEAVFPVVWLLAAVLLGLWLGLIHARAPVRAVLICIGTTMILMMIIASAETVEAMLGIGGKRDSNVFWATHLPWYVAVVTIAALPMGLAATIGGAVARQSVRRRGVTMVDRVRRRRDRRRAAAGSATSAGPKVTA